MTLRLLSGAMAVLFLFGAAVQYNDPDPLRWIAIYAAAGVVCGFAAMQRLHWWLAAAVGVTAVMWAITLAPRAFPNVRMLEMFSAWEMANQRIEEAREMYGLLLIALYMSVLAITAGRRTRRAL